MLSFFSLYRLFVTPNAMLLVPLLYVSFSCVSICAGKAYITLLTSNGNLCSPYKISEMALMHWMEMVDDLIMSSKF